MADSNKPQDPPADAPASPADGDASPASSGPADESAHGASASTQPGEAPPKRRRRRRRGGRNKKAAEGSGPEATPPAAPAALDPGLAALAGGLLSHVDDRQVPCASDGCNQTWTWTAAEQIAAYGQPAPRRECDRCAGTAASEVRCSVEGCRRTWTWSREAQIKHRSWSKRRPDAGRGKKRRRRADGPPRRKCEPCQQKLGRLSERASACKVHGCTRPVMVDRDAQLRAWAAMGTTDLDAEPSLPKQMCDVCREFCRTHDDRPVPCGRPGCKKTWIYKRGAQLQAFLAGRFEDPIRLCSGCESESRKAAHGDGTPANVEVMPCIVPACEGTWFHRAGQNVPACQDGDQPVERMCDEHREANGAKPRKRAGQDSPNEAATAAGSPKPDAPADSSGAEPKAEPKPEAEVPVTDANPSAEETPPTVEPIS